MKSFNLSHDSIESLSLISVDKKLAKAILAVGNFKIEIMKNEFVSLVNFIIGQQLSEKAANTIYQRLFSSVDVISPEVLSNTNDIIFKDAGISKMKTSFIKDLSLKIINNEIDFKQLKKADDDFVIKKLTEIKGIGQWTGGCKKDCVNGHIKYLMEREKDGQRERRFNREAA